MYQVAQKEKSALSKSNGKSLMSLYTHIHIYMYNILIILLITHIINNFSRIIINNICIDTIH